MLCQDLCGGRRGQLDMRMKACRSILTRSRRTGPMRVHKPTFTYELSQVDGSVINAS